MSIALIFNPASGTAEQSQVIREALAPMGDVQLLETAAAGDATRLAHQAALDGAVLVVAAGGDGTINEVVNGLATLEKPPTLGVLPLGTGNDLARTLALPDDPVAAFGVLTTGATRRLDLVQITGADRPRFMLNVAAGGFSGQVDEVLSDEMKATWGPLAYLRSALSVLPDLTSYRTRLRFDDDDELELHALNVIVANGRTAAGGVLVAPTANPEDGLLDVVVVNYGTFGQLLGPAAQLLLDGNYLNSALVTHRRARKVAISATPGMWFNADGELLTNQSLTFTIMPQALPVVVGPDYRASVAQEETG